MVEPSGQELGHFYLEPIMNYVVFALEVIIIIVILVIVAITIIDLFRISISSRRKSQEEKQQQPEHIRAIVSRMLRGLLIALDILVAADIIETIMVPSLFELAQLAIIVIIRILLSWSLSKELENR